MRSVRCPGCGDIEDKVVDSRSSDDGAAIRRRRECLKCAHRFTTFERIEEVVLQVRKRSGVIEPFDRRKVVQGLQVALKGRPFDEEAIDLLALQIEESARLEGPELTSEQLGLAVLERLAEADPVGYLRFASVYKGFDNPEDFQREAGLLKSTPPKVS